MATLTLSFSSTRPTCSGVAATHKGSTMFVSSPFQPCRPLPAKLMNATSRRLQSGRGFSKRVPKTRRWSYQSGSADQKDNSALEENKVSELKTSVAEKEVSGPPFLTIMAGILVAVVVFWGLWSLLSTLVGFFFR